MKAVLLVWVLAALARLAVLPAWVLVASVRLAVLLALLWLVFGLVARVPDACGVKRPSTLTICFWKIIPTSAIITTTATMITASTMFPFTKPAVAYVDATMPGVRASVVIIKKGANFMRVSGNKYVNASFGMPGRKNKMNTITSNLLLSSNF